MGLQRSQKEFVELAAKKHGNFYNYDKTAYIKSVLKVCVTCPLHGDFYILANHHIRGKGCKSCAVIKVSSLKLLGEDEFIRRAVAAHGDKYKYCDSNFINFSSEINLVCSIHGNFLTTPIAHLNSVTGCTKCSSLLKTKNQTKSLTEFLELCTKAHGTKYDYSMIAEYAGAKSSVPIVCSTHGQFNQTAERHYGGAGCPMCQPGGYNNKLPGSLYIFVDSNITKVGITNKVPEARAKYINSRGNMGFKVFTEFYFEDGSVPRKAEKIILKWLREHHSGIEEEFNGSTECFKNVDMTTLIKLIESLI